MRFLANENFPLDAVEALRHQGHDVVWIRTQSPGISDAEVLNWAQTENRRNVESRHITLHINTQEPQAGNRSCHG